MSAPAEVGIRCYTTVARKGGKGGDTDSMAGQQNDAVSLRSQATARILEVLSEGVIKGLHTGDWQSVFLDGTPVANADGSFNFNVPEAYFRTGLPDQDPVPGFTASEAEFNVGVELVYAMPIVRRLSTGIDAVRLKARMNGCYYTDDKGDIKASGSYWSVDMKVGAGDWQHLFTDLIFGVSLSPYERAIRVQLPKTSDPIDIRITRTNPPGSASTINGIFWSSYTEIIDGQLKHDDTALVAVVVDAQYFPTVPTRGYLIDGIICSVPSNYDADARTYAGDWDGTFQQAFTNNPAWVLFDLLTNPRYGIGRDINVTGVDKWSFYEAAQYNDELVPNGYTTGAATEPRFTCNVPINTQQDAYTVLFAVASTMRSLLYYMNGTVYLVQDRPVPEPSRIFGPANVIDGLFDYVGTDYRSKFTAVNVTWNDPDEQYNQNYELVQDPQLVSQQGYRPVDKAAYGCTSRGQAIRFGRWNIYTGQYETETVSFKVAVENCDVRPGERIAINDPGRYGVRLAGRLLASGEVGQLKLDTAVPEIAPGWKIFVTQSGVVSEHDVLDVLAPDLVAVSGMATLGDMPVAGAMWLAHNAAVIEPTAWRLSSVRDAGGSQYELLASQYDEGKYSYVDFGVLIPPPPFSLVPTGPLAPPSSPAKSEYIYLDSGGTVQFGVVVSWQPSTDPRVIWYRVEMVGPGGDYRQFDRVAGVSVEVQPMRQGNWTAYITAADALGRNAVPLTFTFNTVGLSALPQPPAALYAIVQGMAVELEWLPTGEVDVVYFWLRWHPSTDPDVASWEKAITVGPRVTRDTTRAQVPARVGTYFVKTVDSLGQESATAASAVIYDAVQAFEDVGDLIEQTAWAGTLDLWQIASTELFLEPPPEPELLPDTVYPGIRGTAVNSVPTRQSYYGFANALDMGAGCAVQVTAIIEAFGTIGDVSISTWVPLASAIPLAKGSSSNWDAAIEISTSDDGSTFGAWTPLKAATQNFRAIQARMSGVLYDIETTLRVARCELHVEAAERDETDNGVAIDGTGHASVEYDPHFFATPNLQLTPHASGTSGISLVITATDKDGFTVEQRDHDGAVLGGGTFDWRAQGHGVSA